MPEFKKSHSTPNSDQSASLYIPRRRNGSCACFFTAFAHSKYYCREKERLSVPEPDKAEADVYIDLKCGRIVPKTNFNSSIGNKPASYEGELQETENRKYDLLKAIQDTQRGLVTTADQRSCIEEALVCVEGYDAGSFIDMGKLNGTWRLQYTSAPDVLLLLDAATKLPFFQVGQIFQTFECQGQNNGGYVRNVVSWSIPNLLEEQEGATLLVSAKFSVLSLRSIYLQFEEITIKNIYISEVLQSLIAPAILPRSFLSLQLLQSIRAFEAQFPVINTGRQFVGGLYYLSYLDGNMLLGRAVASGGVFVFTRAQTFV